MTNSEIKKDELKPCPFCGYSKPSIIIDEYAPIPYLGYKGGIEENVTCPQCLTHVDKNIWNTRTPEPTKAENGLVPLDEKALSEFIGEDQGWEESAVILAKKICAKFGTPSITKEQELREWLCPLQQQDR